MDEIYVEVRVVIFFKVCREDVLGLEIEAYAQLLQQLGQDLFILRSYFLFFLLLLFLLVLLILWKLHLDLLELEGRHNDGASFLGNSLDVSVLADSHVECKEVGAGCNEQGVDVVFGIKGDGTGTPLRA
mmetsp:Transcript_32391/g.31683  ORF Transcript_32391/g.31683 Transcript_32391/m.31683 type:complete len:129 (-) Transcript_32391:181-567(-)